VTTSRQKLLAPIYALQRLLWRTFRLRTRGVKVMVFDQNGRILLIRNSYGDASLFVLPGGGVGLLEDTERAARREVREEVGCALGALTLVGVYHSEREGKRDSIWLYEAMTNDTPTPDLNEVAEAGFFMLDDLPAKLSPATARRIGERAGAHDRSTAW
jgi:ADP-ribose pyrophosphatase YjhB (NUDIX family)